MTVLQRQCLLTGLDPQNLPGLTSPEAGIPAKISGTPTLQQFLPTSGHLNLCNTYRNTALSPSTQRTAVLASGHFAATDSIDLFAEVAASESRLRSAAGALIDATGGSFGGTVLGASNPYNPFGQDVGISFAYAGLPAVDRFSENWVHPLIGLRGVIFSNWSYGGFTAYVSRDQFVVDVPPYANPAALQTALTSADPATALNPFLTSVSASSPPVASLISGSSSGGAWHYADQIIDAEAMLRGPVLHLPAGALDVVVGGDYSQLKQQHRRNPGPRPTGSWPPRVCAVRGSPDSAARRRSGTREWRSPSDLFGRAI